ncbi:hypothetical protein Aph02nite_86420 [Actinoplanes philippinensis]|uniref:Uncharacterized protein n=2 Tax=Actinoplanes philippinensis TaxID=35752 RepID=A0A1I2LMT2_9ACTN|nr:hypothetical protein Aph02nite_86420 [Actinoplanes philippinensis]SFF80604.1 hypothetical protein SAMN05421541_1235 [Actinoplanes philippinensis]
MVSVAALTGGCATEDKPRIPVGEARPLTPVTLAAPDRSGMVPFTAWPAACDLLPEPTVREVLPAATTIVINRLAPTGDFAEKELVLPGDAECQIGVDLADAKPAASGKVPVRIQLTLWMVGTPELARKTYDENIAVTAGDKRTTCPPELVTASGMDACTDDGNAWTFLKNGVAGELRGRAPVLRDGFNFEGRKKGVSNGKIWHGTVHARLLQAVVTRLP